MHSSNSHQQSLTFKHLYIPFSTRWLWILRHNCFNLLWKASPGKKKKKASQRPHGKIALMTWSYSIQITHHELHIDVQITKDWSSPRTVTPSASGTRGTNGRSHTTHHWSSFKAYVGTLLKLIFRENTLPVCKMDSLEFELIWLAICCQANLVSWWF